MIAMSAKAEARELEKLRDAGVKRAVRWMPCAGPRAESRPALERCEAAFAELNGE